MAKPKIMIEVVDKKGKFGCHRGHAIGDRFDFDTERGLICPMALHSMFPHIDILRYGGSVPASLEHGDIRVCCPDADVMTVFRLEML